MHNKPLVDYRDGMFVYMNPDSKWIETDIQRVDSSQERTAVVYEYNTAKIS